MEALLKWLARVQTETSIAGRPVITISYAQSLDGCLAIQRGQPLHLSGLESSRMTHHLRSAHDEILVGIGTVLADDPQLNVRLVEGNDPRPVVLDTRLRIPDGCRLLMRKRNLPWIVTQTGAETERCVSLERRGARVLQVPAGEDGGVDLQAALARLHQEGITRLMVEGGARVIAAFLRAGLADAAVVTIAPVWLGGLHIADGPMTDRQMETTRTVPSLTIAGSEQMGEDFVVWGTFMQRPV